MIITEEIILFHEIKNIFKNELLWVALGSKDTVWQLLTVWPLSFLWVWTIKFFSHSSGKVPEFKEVQNVKENGFKFGRATKFWHPYSNTNMSKSFILDLKFLSQVKSMLNSIKIWVFSEKNTEKNHFCYHNRNYCYFCKSKIPDNNLIVGSINMIKVSKNISLEKIR